MYTDILFDLDGTINESGRGIQQSFRSAMQEWGQPVPEDTDLDFIIGPPLWGSFRKMQVPEEHVSELLEIFRRYYRNEGIYNNAVYPGMRELLENLRAKGKRLYVATAKPVVMAGIVVDYFDIRKYFEFVEAAKNDSDNKTDVLGAALKKIPSPKEQIVMVGDRRDDMEAAAAHGIDSVGVLYGYGTRQELEQSGAKRIVQTVKELEALL